MTLSRRRFRFLDPGDLVDDDLMLFVSRCLDSHKSWFRVPEYDFEMRHASSDDFMGRISLRVGNDENIVRYMGHIGYGVRPTHRGHRYAARACRLLFPLAKRHGLDPLWITCNPDNIASTRTCEIAGGELVEIVALPRSHPNYQSGERLKRRYRFDL